jgi:hypothetical protein
MSHHRLGLASVVALCVATVIGCGVSREEAKKRLAEADALWDRDEKAEAVRKYKAAYGKDGKDLGQLTSSEYQEAVEKIFPRIVAIAIETGNTEEAKTWLKHALYDPFNEKHNLESLWTEPPTVELVAAVKKDHEEGEAARKAEEERKRKEAEAKAAPGDLGSNGTGSDGKVYTYDPAVGSYYYRDSNGKPVHVNGYYRKDGTHVQSYNRAAPGVGTSSSRPGRRR